MRSCRQEMKLPIFTPLMSAFALMGNVVQGFSAGTANHGVFMDEKQIYLEDGLVVRRRGSSGPQGKFTGVSLDVLRHTQLRGLTMEEHKKDQISIHPTTTTTTTTTSSSSSSPLDMFVRKLKGLSCPQTHRFSFRIVSGQMFKAQILCGVEKRTSGSIA